MLRQANVLLTRIVVSLTVLGSAVVLLLLQHSSHAEEARRVLPLTENWDIPKLIRHIEKQRDALNSLSLRVRRSATIADNKSQVATAYFQLPVRAGVDESILAYHGNSQYARTLELDYFSKANVGNPSAEPRTYSDVALAVCNDRVLGRHRNIETGKHEFTDALTADVKDGFRQHSFVRNIGWAKPDPTASPQAKQKAELWSLPQCLRRGTYSIDGLESIGDASCLRITGQFEFGEATTKAVPNLNSVDDTIWLDLDHGMAVRARNITNDAHLIEIRNKQFEELSGGLWLPRKSQVRMRNVGDSVEQAVFTESVLLQKAHAASVPEELFTVALTPKKASRLRGKKIAYHYTQRWGEFGNCKIEEGWNRPGVGWRFEVRDRDGDLALLQIDNGKVHFSIMPRLKRALLSRSRKVNSETDQRRIYLSPDFTMLAHLHETIRRGESLTGLMAKEHDTLLGQPAIKITSWYPADPILPVTEAGLQPLEWPIHEFDPKVILDFPDMKFRTRTHWFHPKHKFPTKRKCGCKTPKYRYSVEYPDDPNTISPDLFKFNIPKDVKVDAEPSELLRVLDKDEPNREH